MEKMLKRLEMDLDYLERRSWWEDIKIMFLTVYHVAAGKKF
jgi:lipopolysaccharide/colanic/teichoic acid biosynthesis glycosyltransferase